jgi:hypothetical protein
MACQYFQTELAILRDPDGFFACLFVDFGLEHGSSIPNSNQEINICIYKQKKPSFQWGWLFR